MAKKPANDRRRRADEIRRKQAAKERRRTLVAIGVAVALGGLLIGLAVWQVRDKTPDERPLPEIGVLEAEAGCSPVENATPIPGGGHRAGPIEYPQSPPNGGPHNDQTLSNARRFIQREQGGADVIERSVHNLEHGLVIAWYDEKLPEAEVEVLREVVTNASNRFMAIPWNRADFPEEKHFVLTAWGHTQRCGRVSGEVVKKFIDGYTDKDAPERGGAV